MRTASEQKADELFHEIQAEQMYLLCHVTDEQERQRIQADIDHAQMRRHGYQLDATQEVRRNHTKLKHAFTLWIQRQMHENKIDEFTDEEARLATYLMQQDERGRPLSFRDIAGAEGCSQMAIKRRVDSLRKRHKAFSNWLERNIPRKPGRVALQNPTKTKND